ncbi:MAG: agmatinase [Thermofilum sp.]|jgi:agmatinase|nr:agmatinase [Thermofilum sp.]
MSRVQLPLLRTYAEEVYPTLFGRRCRPEEGRVVFLGAPFDSTTSGIPGQRLAPRRVREASMELETFDPTTGRDSEEADFCDAGDIPLVVDHRVLTEVLGGIAREVLTSGKVLAVCGGDHFVTYPVVKAAAEVFGEVQLVVFDAHLDLRDEYPVRCKYSHATVMRRLVEEVAQLRVVYFRPRAFSREEWSFASSRDNIVIAGDAENLLSSLKEGYKVYVSIDIDYVDPAYAPGVGSPEPLGGTPEELVAALKALVGKRKSEIAGVDIVEVNPLLDAGSTTSALAAKLWAVILRELSAL